MKLLLPTLALIFHCATGAPSSDSLAQGGGLQHGSSASSSSSSSSHPHSSTSSVHGRGGVDNSGLARLARLVAPYLLRQQSDAVTSSKGSRWPHGQDHPMVRNVKSTNPFVYNTGSKFAPNGRPLFAAAGQPAVSDMFSAIVDDSNEIGDDDLLEPDLFEDDGYNGGKDGQFVALSKRQYDDYGHLRFGKRDFDDYGHMRFGRSADVA